MLHEHISLSLGQIALWHSYRKDSKNVTYKIQYAWKMRELNLDILKAVLADLHTRHCLWRSMIKRIEEMPFFVTHEHLPLDFEVVDAQGLTDEALLERVGSELYRPMDLAHQAPVYWRYFSLGHDEGVLTLLTHHAVFDGCSLMTVIEELGRLYRARVEGRSHDLEPLLLTNADFVQAQAELVRSERGQESASFWREKLGDALPLLDLPTDAARTPTAPLQPSQILFTFPDQLLARIKALAASEGLSLSSFFLATYQLLLQRYSGQDRIVTGVPTVGREGDFLKLLGCYVNPVIQVTSFPDGATVRAYLQRAASAFRESLKHSKYPLSLVVQDAAFVPDADRHPLYQTIFNWEALNHFPQLQAPMIEISEGRETWNVGGLCWERLPVLLQIDPFDLSIRISRAGDGFHATLVFDASLYARERMERMSRNYIALLEAVCENLDAQLSQLALAEPDDQVYALAVQPAAVDEPSAELLQLQGIWCDIFDLEHIPFDHDFFQMGGHSLLIYRIRSRVRSEFGVEVAYGQFFNHPTLRKMAQLIVGLIAELPEDQRIISSLKTEKQPADDRTSQTPGQVSRPINQMPAPQSYADIPSASDGHSRPASLFQERMYFIQTLNPLETAYHIPFALELSAGFDVALLEQALGLIIARHENLRTSFSSPNHRQDLRQIIHAEMALRVRVQTYASIEHREQILVENTNAPFDLYQGPLWAFYQLEPEHGNGAHLLQAVIHHLIFDGWSWEIFLSELGVTYRTLAEGQIPRFEPLPLQFADFVAWQRAQAPQQQDPAQAYWKNALAGAPVILDMPTDHLRPSHICFEGSVVSFQIENALCERLSSRFRGQNVTPFMTMLSAFAILMYRYSNQDDMLIGTPVSTRDRPETHGLMGCFVNTLVLRAQLHGNPSFSDWVGRIQRRVLDAMDHSQFSFERLVELIQPDRELSRNPLFQVIFAYQSQGQRHLDAGPLKGKNYPFDRQRVHVDLTLNLEETENGLLGRIDFSTRLFDRIRIERMATHFKNLITQVAEDTELRIGDMDLLSEEERRTLLSFGQETQDFPCQGIHEPFFAWAERKPDRVALYFEDATYTYGEIAQEARELAGVLRARGIGPERVVALCLERQKHLLVAIYGILLAGGAYVSLDPAYPADRLEYILDDTGCQVILTQLSLSGLLPDASADKWFLDDPAGFKSQPTQIGCNLDELNLAYFIYTSGSTGKPKGVAIAHRSATALVYWAREVFDDDELSAVLWSTSTNFDLSIFEIFGPLSWGGAAVLVPNALALLDIGTTDVSLVNTVPSIMHELIKAKAIPKSVRTICLGGELLPVDLARKIIQTTSIHRLISLWGPSEDTTFSSYGEVKVEYETITLGVTIPNTRAYILDPKMRLLPMGVSGEIYLSGEGLGRGYLNRPSLTAERFLAHPWGETCGARIYKTGDRGRFRENGEIEFHGRLDHQVKLRGFRVELGEIEARFLDMPEIDNVVVMVREDIPGIPRLVAYLVPGPGHDPSPDDLSLALKAFLPDYMVPNTYVLLPSFPRTASGKIDRTALPKPQIFSPKLTQKRELVGDEAVLAQIWRQVMGVTEVDLEDNFFAIGGHSLLAIRLLIQIGETFSCNIPLAAFFLEPTLKGLAHLLSIAQAKAVAPPQAAEVEEVPLTYAQQSLWFIDQLAPQNPVYNVMVGLHLKGILSVQHLSAALDHLVERHELLRARYPSIQGEPSLHIAAKMKARLALIDCTGRLDLARAIAVNESKNPFDLAVGPLFRLHLLRVEADHHLLLFNTHHIISDASSIGLFCNELSVVYGQFLEGGTPDMVPLSSSFGEFARQQRGLVASSEFAPYRSFWEEQLKGAPMVLDLPLDHSRPSLQSFRGAWERFDLPSEILPKLKAISLKAKVTPFVTLSSVFGLLLSRIARQDDLLIGTPVDGRNGTALQSVFGYFINSLALRMTFDPQLTFTNLLHQTRSTVLSAWSHSAMPFDILVDEHQKQRDLSRNPIFQVMITYHARKRAVGSTALTMEVENFESGVSHFDLTLYLEDQEDGIATIFEYNIDLFERTTIRRMADQFTALLDEALSAPDQVIGSFSMMTRAQAQKLILDQQQSVSPFPQISFHEHVSQYALSQPQHPAIVFKSESWTYAELDLTANRIAHHLRLRGFGPECLIGLCMDRSARMQVMMLAVLKVGAAFLPLDPSFPSERLNFYLKDSGATLLVAEPDYQARFAGTGVTTVTVEQLCDAASDLEGEPSRPLDPSHAAYVIYTSGSTGVPKGVLVEHGSWMNLAQSFSSKIKLTSETRGLSVASISFDASILEAFLPLYVGGTNIYASKADCLHGTALMDLVKRERINLAVITPVTARLMLSSGWEEPLPIDIICGGEVLTPALTRDLLARVKSIWNGYGPTEATVACTASRLSDPEQVTIGWPLANTQVYICDAQGLLVPEGLVGELLIGGAGMARHYHGRPALTATRFVPNPFSDKPGSRLYRSGDLARITHDGSFGFVGRIDTQVKLRGFRIELGEIEYALEQLDDVAQAVAQVWHRSEDDDRLIAYLTPRKGKVLKPEAILAQVNSHLPSYMLPSEWVVLDAMPISPSGKVDRRRLPMPETRRPETPGPEARVASLGSGLANQLADVWAQVLGHGNFGHQDPFFEVGGNSLLLIKLKAQLERQLERDFPIALLFQYPSIAALANFMEPQAKQKPDERVATSKSADHIAVTGMVGRFPGATDLEGFWGNLHEGRISVQHFGPEGKATCEQDEDFVFAKGLVEGFDCFDAEFFGYAPAEAQLMDPQQRWFLEGCWQALESAACDPETFPGRIGVFAGASMNTYQTQAMAANPELMADVGIFAASLASQNDFLATRVAYKLDLTGPALTVQTACSTSLVSIHLACKSLKDHECDLALAGGVALQFPMVQGYSYAAGGTLAPDGLVRPFDHRAAGMVPGNGMGIVVLRRLEEAQREGDQIFAIVKSSAINNDGGKKQGFTSPSPGGQARAIQDCFEMGAVDPATISYVEAHGTATALGDPVEIAALTQAFRSQTEQRQYCAIGSVKANVGHLDAAAGVCGFIKTVLSLKHRILPASLNYERANPTLGIAETPFFVNTETRPWLGEGPLRAGVSSFGLGGTNAHVILEQAPDASMSTPSQGYHCLPLSAQSKGALARRISDLVAYFEQHPQANLADVAFSLQRGRQALTYRYAVAAADPVEAITALKALSPTNFNKPTFGPSSARLTLLFPGQGTAYPGMGRDLYQREPRFAREIDEMAEILLPLLGQDIRDFILCARDDQARKAQLQRTVVQQPTLFAVAYATAQVWLERGQVPTAMIGHSVGEYVAATLAGVMTRDAALALVSARGRLMQALPEGAMVLVPLSATELDPWLSKDVELAAINAPQRCVLAGTRVALEVLVAKLTELGHHCSWLETSHAFHSSMMEPALAPFKRELLKINLQKPSIPFISNLSGDWITPAQAVDPDYWAAHMRQTVRFAPGLAALRDQGSSFLLEVGPGQSLLKQARQTLGTEIIGGGSLGTANLSDSCQMALSHGKLWSAGLAPHWERCHQDQARHRLNLPTYPFEAKRHWIDPVPASRQRVSVKAPVPTHKGRLSLDQWTYAPLWRETPPTPRGSALADGQRNWLIFADEEGFTADLALRIRALGGKVISVHRAGSHQRPSATDRVIDPQDRNSYIRLMAELLALGFQPEIICHGWCLDVGATLASSRADLASSTISLFFIAAALDESKLEEPLRFSVLTHRLQRLVGEAPGLPIQAPALGALAVIEREYGFPCRALDLQGVQHHTQRKAMVEAVVSEHLQLTDEPIIALRGTQRWAQSFHAAPLAPLPGMPELLRAQGTYLITGGLGHIGLLVAEYLAKTAQANLILLGRSPLPHPETWTRHLAEQPASKTAAILRRIQAMEALGAQVMTASADVADLEAMGELVRTARRRFGGIHGVFHAAGSAGSGWIPSLRADKMAEVLAPKVQGTLVLDQLFRSAELDLFVLFSSTSTLLGNAGYGDYAAANAFLDAFAVHQNSESSTYYLSVNWDGWSQSGLSVSTEQASADPLLIQSHEGIQVLERILGEGKRSRVAVCPQDLEGMLASIRDAALTRQAKAACAKGPLAVLAEADHEAVLRKLWQSSLGVSELRDDANFEELGGDSLLATHMASLLRKQFKVRLSAQTLAQDPTLAGWVRSLKAALATDGTCAPAAKPLAEERHPSSEKLQAPVRVTRTETTRAERQDQNTPSAGLDIAVIGIGLRLPGANSPDQFWSNLVGGVSSVAYYSRNELTEAGVPSEWIKDPFYVPARATIENLSGFDADFFSFSAREANITDPQQRIFLETAWEALEHAGYVPEQYPGRIGIYAGVGRNHYYEDYLQPRVDLETSVSGLELTISNDRDSFATRMAYKLNLTGIALTLQTACSTGLVAIHLACQGLRTGDTDMALAGGIALRELEPCGYFADVLQPEDGVCRPFDADAQGTVPGQGSAVVLLKRAEQAYADGDTVYALIQGSSVNNDGGNKSGFTHYNRQMQREVIERALAGANLQPADVHYIETSSTASKIGDAIEFAAMCEAFGPSAGKEYCALGALKPNIGGTDIAASIAAFVKVVLALNHRELPPTLGFHRPNPELDIANSPFYVNTQTLRWAQEQPMVAGVSGFGMGGTNAHLILRESTAVERHPTVRSSQLLILSARNAKALASASQRLLDHLKQAANLCLADVAYTLQVGRRAHGQRRSLVVSSVAEAVHVLEQDLSQGSAIGTPTAISFSFAVAEIRLAVARDWMAQEPCFRHEMGRLWDVVGKRAPEFAERLGPVDALLVGTGLLDAGAHPLMVFMVQYALAQTLMRWGIRPSQLVSGCDAVLPACLAGVLDLEQALDLQLVRCGILKQAQPCQLKAPKIPVYLAHEERWINAENFATWQLEQVNELERVSLPADAGLVLEFGHCQAAAGAAEADRITTCFPQGPHVEDSGRHLNQLLGQLWEAGYELDWQGFHAHEPRQRIALPTYPFQRQECWLHKEERPLLSESERFESEDPVQVKWEQTDIETYVQDLWSRRLGLATVDIHADFFALGGNSLIGLGLIREVNKRFALRFEPSLLLQARTVAHMARALFLAQRQPQEGGALKSLVQIQVGSRHKQPLFLVHPIGGEVLFYRELVQNLDPELPVYGLSAPSLSGDGPAYVDLPTQAEAYVNELLALPAMDSFLLGGASYGGLLALEMAQQLVRRGKKVPLLIAIDSPGPGHMPRALPSSAAILAYLLGEILDFEAADLEDLPSHQQIKLVRQWAAASAQSQAIAESLDEALLETWFGHQQAMFAYQPEPYAGKILYFRPSEAMRENPMDMYRGWMSLAQNELEIIQIGGTHLTMNSGKHARDLARHIQAALDGGVSPEIQQEEAHV